MTMMPRIAIIGGGISGLAATHRLIELLPGACVELFEAEHRLGGVIDTVSRDGFLIERAADNFLQQPPAALALCRRIGIDGELLPTDAARRRAFVIRSGQLLPIPDGFYLMAPRKLRPLLASPLLSLSAKLRVLLEPFIPPSPVWPRNRELGTLNSQPSTLNPDCDESVASFTRRRLGTEVFERLVQPLVAGIYTADPEKLSMAATMPRFVAQEREHGSLLRATLFGDEQKSGRLGEQLQTNDASTAAATGARYSLFVAPKRGMTRFIDVLAERLPPENIHLNKAVINIAPQPDGRWQLDFGPPFDAIIIAIPAPAAAKLLIDCNAELAAELSAIEYAGCAVVSLGFHRRQIGHHLDGFGFVVPQIERRRIIAASFASVKFPGRAPEDAVLVRVFVGGALQPELLELPGNDLLQLALDELSSLLRITGDPVISDIARWPRSMPQYHVGHLARVARIEALAARHPRLALAGNAYHGVGIPQCIASGQAAAEQIAERWLS
jgi:protoporphyrinogen/coproporphyrinogen III oxidase